jgi:hypothetical protein
MHGAVLVVVRGRPSIVMVVRSRTTVDSQRRRRRDGNGLAVEGQVEAVDVIAAAPPLSWPYMYVL